MSDITIEKLNVLDEGLLDIDSPSEPWSIQVEVRASRKLNHARLADALRSAVARHPMARACLRPLKLTDWRRVWEIHPDVDRLPLQIVEASSPEELAAARSVAYSECPSLESPPPLVLTCVRYPKGDYLLLNMHHAAADGLSAFRLMFSVIRNYAGEPDPTPDIDPLTVRDLTHLAGSASAKERMQRCISLLEILATSITAPIRIKSRADDATAPGYGFVTIALDPEESKRVAARRKKPGTINDVLLAAFARSIHLWNRRQGGARGRISIMMPVNLRPAEWWHEVVSNFSSYVSVSVPRGAQADFDKALSAVTQQTRKVKEAGTAGLLIDLLELRTLLPPVLRRKMVALLPLSGNRLYDTTMLSNVGRLPQPPSFGAAGGKIQEVWFSPPATMPLGLTVGAASLADRMFLTLRHRHAKLNSAAATEFAALFRAVLTET